MHQGYRRSPISAEVMEEKSDYVQLQLIPPHDHINSLQLHLWLYATVWVLPGVRSKRLRLGHHSK